MRKLVSTTLLGMALATAGCGTTMSAKSKTVTTSWTCPTGTAPDPHNQSPNCNMQVPVAQTQPPPAAPPPQAKIEAPPPLRRKTKARPAPRQVNLIQFETGSAELTAASKATLDQLAASLRQDQAVRDIRIDGRTDNTGPEHINDQLSQQRAEAVKSYLQDHGIASEKFETKALGETVPHRVERNLRRSRPEPQRGDHCDEVARRDEGLAPADTRP